MEVGDVTRTVPVGLPARAATPAAVPVPRAEWARVPTPARHPRRTRLLTLAVVIVAAAGVVLAVRTVVPAPAAPGVATGACGPAWATAWQAAEQPVDAPPHLAGGTLRMIVTPQVAGAQLRIRLSNTYGTGPLTVAAVTVGRAGTGAELQAGSAAAAGFAGRPDVVIPPGADVTSDPVPVATRAGVPLAVSAAVPVAPRVVSGHAVALETSWLADGDVAAAPAAGPFGTALPSWYLLAGVDVLAARPVDALVAVGDSITDGVGTAPGSDTRWTDALAARLAAAGGTTTMAVLNAGISRNELLSDVQDGGDTPLARFDHDVAQAAGATDVVLHVGTNDLAAGAGAEAVEAGMVAFADRARAAGKRVFLTTITPSRSGVHGTRSAVARRAAVNAWVREHGREHADGVLDFAAAVADPADPTRLAPAFDTGDGLHLSAAGYRALADAIDVRVLSGSPCLAR